MNNEQDEYFQVGDATDPQSTDSCFLNYEAAEEDALLHSEENEYVVAIWRMNKRTGNAETLRLVFQGCVWFADY